ncbi:DoxX family protein [Nocardia gipuzkoensis]|uniref:DoxX family protein n=1 Tax=Nocardia gipuzkoensis TaxID=2749991 RepID=UPI0015EE6322|nr:DoxX family protein [Nocardia gipuzkoensis]
MKIALWSAQIALAMLFTYTGVLKVRHSREELAAKIGPWVNDFPDGTMKALGTSEILGAVALVVPPAVGALPVLTPVASTGLAITMIGAIAVHSRYREYAHLPVNGVLLALTAFVAWGRFGTYEF